MKIETVILSCLKEHIPDMSENDELMIGISQYAQDNHIQSLLKDDQAFEVSKLMVSAFLEPFYKMPVAMVDAYFVNYSLIKKFKLLSNTIFDLACQKKKSCENPSLSAELEEKVISCIARIYSQKELEKAYNAEISDVILEMDYLKNKTDKLSLRLSRTV